MISPTYSFRPVVFSADLPFLRELYASTRQEELAQTGWPQEQIAAFLVQQFDAQHYHYTHHCQDADFDLILDENEEPIGRLYLEERTDEFRVIDIAILPQNRGHGIGEKIMRDILRRGRNASKLVRIHVETDNPAMRLYVRLGFQAVEDQGVYRLMQWEPELATSGV